MQSIVVTGVSTGIGWAITKVLIQNGFRVFGSVRKLPDAERLSKEFGNRFMPVLFDVTDESGVQVAAQQVREQLHGETLFGLINNAGIAVPGPLMHLATEDFRHQIEVNLVSVLIVTKAFLPLLGADRSMQGKPGRIVNISSVGSRFVWPGAVLATVLWLLATTGFGWYVRHVAHYNVMYGSIGAGIALLVWMYLLAAIALIGCEFNAAYERSVAS